MAENKIKTRVQLKIDSTSGWETAGEKGFIPRAGEPIFYTAEEDLPPRLKIGDGFTNVSNLPFVIERPSGIMAYDQGDGNIVLVNSTEALLAENSLF